MTTPQLIDEAIERIGRDYLHLRTLATRRDDVLDFHELPVWEIRDALRAAYEAGVKGRPA